MISPAGFETYFDEVAAIAEAEGNPPDFAKISDVAGRCGLVFHMEMMPDLMEHWLEGSVYMGLLFVAGFICVLEMLGVDFATSEKRKGKQ